MLLYKWSSNSKELFNPDSSCSFIGFFKSLGSLFLCPLYLIFIILFPLIYLLYTTITFLHFYLYKYWDIKKKLNNFKPKDYSLKAYHIKLNQDRKIRRTWSDTITYKTFLKMFYKNYNLHINEIKDYEEKEERDANEFIKKANQF